MGSQSERIVSLQILRFVAAMMVTVFHSRYLAPALAGVVGSGPIFNVAAAGTAGVDIFFVLSGFVIAMTGPLATPRPSGALFFWRRWRRVAPIYFIVSLPVIVAAWRAAPLSVDRLVATVFFWPVIGKGFALPYLEPGWTLCFEMAFYFTVSLVLAGRRLALNLALGAVVLAALIIASLGVHENGARFLANPMFLEFAGGVGLAFARKHLLRMGALPGAILLGLGFGALGVEAVLGLGDVDKPLLMMAGAGATHRVLIFGVPACAIVAGALGCEAWSRGPIARIFALGGDISYAIYLTNLIAMDAIIRVWRIAGAPANAPAMVAAGIATALAFGMLTYQIVEKPILSDLKRLRPIPSPWRTVPETPA